MTNNIIWKSQIDLYLAEENYEGVASFCEQLIHENTNDRSAYWYFGLIQFLQDKEEEALMTWFSAIAEGSDEQTKAWITELIEILHTEAKRQEVRCNYSRALSIRQYIFENSHDNLNNLFLLILDSIKVREFVVDLDSFLPEVMRQLEDKSSLQFEPQLLLEVFRKINKEYPESIHYSGFKKAVINFYNRIIQIEPNVAESHFHLGNIYFELKLNEQTIACYSNALKLNSKYAEVYFCLGNLDLNNGNIEQAVSYYNHAIQIDPNFAKPYVNLAHIFLTYQGRQNEAIAYLKKALQINPDYPEAFYNLAAAFSQHGNFEEAISYYKKAIQARPDYPEAHYNLGVMLSEKGMIEETIAACQKSIEIDPNSNAYKFFYLSVPILYDNEEDIGYWRQRVEWGLEQFVKKIQVKLNRSGISESEFKRNAQWCLNSILITTNFYLAYQAQNDAGFQRQYGKIVQSITAAIFPQWSWERTLTIPSLKAGEKIRIGYVSACLCDHAATRLVLNWLRYSDPEQFEIYCYHIGKEADGVTESFAKASHVFRHIPLHKAEDIGEIGDRITTDNLHILVFIDIGMYPYATAVAALRLAPVQCSSWAHPVTSGLSTIDYFLSSDLMEPDDAVTHYTENLIRLPNLAIAYSKPLLPNEMKPRPHFQLPENSILYFCCQSLYKYLPQYDYIFAKIATLIPLAKFLFIVHHKSAYLTQRFSVRLAKTFTDYGLSFQSHIIFLPRLSTDEYLNVHMLSDVFLDSFGWSGGNTTFEAIACDSPVVTCPGEFMRGRHAYGILRMLGVTDTIAQTEAEYIEIAVRLGRDLDWRTSIIEKMRARHTSLYDDRTCIKGLEDFYKQIVRTKNGDRV